MDNNLINSEVYKIDKNNFLENAEHLKNALDKIWKELEKLTTFVEGEEADKDGNILIDEDTKNKEVQFSLPLLITYTEAMFTYIFDLHLKSKINNIKNKYDIAIITKQNFDLYNTMRQQYFEKFLTTLENFEIKLCIYIELRATNLFINLFSMQCGHAQLIYEVDKNIIDNKGQIKQTEKRKKELKEMLLEAIKPAIEQFKELEPNLKHNQIFMITEQEILNKLLKPEDLF